MSSSSRRLYGSGSSTARVKISPLRVMDRLMARLSHPGHSCRRASAHRKALSMPSAWAISYSSPVMRAISSPVSSSRKESSVLRSVPSSRARGASRARSGQLAPRSHLFTAGAVTPRAWATCSWVRPFSFRMRRMLALSFMNTTPPFLPLSYQRAGAGTRAPYSAFGREIETAG